MLLSYDSSFQSFCVGFSRHRLLVKLSVVKMMVMVMKMKSKTCFPAECASKRERARSLFVLFSLFPIVAFIRFCHYSRFRIGKVSSNNVKCQMAMNKNKRSDQ